MTNLLIMPTESKHLVKIQRTHLGKRGIIENLFLPVLQKRNPFNLPNLSLLV